MPAFLSRVAPVAEEALDAATSFDPVPWQNRAPWSFAELYRFHYANIRAAREASSGPGYVVLVIHNEDRFVGHGCVTLGDRNASHTFVVGRHPRSDVRLAADPSVALRQLIVRVTLDAGRRPVLRLLDLHTPHGFVLDGVGPCSAAVSDGEVMVRIGSYVLVFVPLRRDGRPWSDDPDIGLAERQTPVVRDCRLLDQRTHETPRVADGEGSLTVLPGASVLGTGEADATAADVVATLSIEGPAGETTFPLTERQLEHGVLVGRYPRCDVDGHAFRNAEAVSRVHLLLIREGEDVLAIDVASTNGILVNRLETRVGRLAPQCTIELGAGNVARWQLTGRWHQTRARRSSDLN